MKTCFLILSVLGLIFVIQSCEKQTAEPYIILKDGNANIIDQDTIEVESISVHELLIESGFIGSFPSYSRQINNGDIMDISALGDVLVVSSGFSEIDFEKAVITTNITNMNITSGSIVKTTVRLGTDLGKSVYYKVK